MWLLSPAAFSESRWSLPCLAANAPEPRGEMENTVLEGVILILPCNRIEGLREWPGQCKCPSATAGRVVGENRRMLKREKVLRKSQREEIRELNHFPRQWRTQPCRPGYPGMTVTNSPSLTGNRAVETGWPPGLPGGRHLPRDGPFVPTTFHPRLHLIIQINQLLALPRNNFLCFPSHISLLSSLPWLLCTIVPGN